MGLSFRTDRGKIAPGDHIDRFDAQHARRAAAGELAASCWAARRMLFPSPCYHPICAPRGLSVYLLPIETALAPWVYRRIKISEALRGQRALD